MEDLKCPLCGKWNSATVQECTHCGWMFNFSGQTSVEKNPATENIPKYRIGTITKRTRIRWAIFSAILLLFFLSFHIVPSRLMIFPKENLSFSNTFITQKDINELIERYNNAFFERFSIQQEPLFKKLMEKGVIYDKSKKTD